jgi:hypothetical protein
MKQKRLKAHDFPKSMRGVSKAIPSKKHSSHALDALFPLFVKMISSSAPRIPSIQYRASAIWPRTVA